jgi:hypothetical protein
VIEEDWSGRTKGIAFEGKGIMQWACFCLWC